MNTLSFLCAAGLLVWTTSATGINFDDPYAEYKREMSSEPTVSGSRFIGTWVKNAARQPTSKSKTYRIGQNTAPDGAVNLASPTINGNLYGNVSVIVEKGALSDINVVRK